MFMAHVFSKMVVRLSMLLYLLCYCPMGFAQKSAAFYKDTAAVKTMLAQARVHPIPDSAIVLYRKVAQKCREAGYDRNAVYALICLTHLHLTLGDYASLHKCVQQALAYNPTVVEKLSLYGNSGAAYMATGDMDMATREFHKVLHEYENLQTADTCNAAIIYSNLAQICNNTGQYDQMEYYLRKGESIARNSNFDYGLVLVLTLKASSLKSKISSDSVRAILFEVLELAKNSQMNDHLAMVSAEIGTTYVDSKQSAQAIKYFRDAIEQSRGRNVFYFLESSRRLAQALRATGAYDEAERTLRMVVNTAKQSQTKDVELRARRELLHVYKDQKKYELALAGIDSLLLLSDSVGTLEKTKAVNMMEVKYKTAEKDKQILQQKEMLNRKNLLLVAVIGCILVVSVLSLAYYNKAVGRQRLQAEQLKSLGNENKIAVLKAAVQGEDKERTRIARDLHDGIGGMLSAAIMRFSTLHHDNKMIKDIPAYRESMDMLKEIGDEIRKTAHNLMPEVLLKQSLEEAIHAYCNNIRPDASLQINFQCYGDFVNLTDYYKINVYRMVQELLKNMVHHAAATTALVQLTATDQTLTITVEDNGVGYDMTRPATGLGLVNLQTRVSSLDGTIAVKSVPGGGTSVFIELPFL